MTPIEFGSSPPFGPYREMDGELRAEVISTLIRAMEQGQDRMPGMKSNLLQRAMARRHSRGDRWLGGPPSAER